MKICHISDWHGNLMRLPPADLYVVTGDMLPNFPLMRIMIDKWRRDGTVTYDPFAPHSGPPPAGVYAGRILDKKIETARQTEWCMQQPFRTEVGLSEDAPVLVVKGNHDFIPLSDWIGGDVWEVDQDPTRTTTLFGLKFGGVRGINYIRGEWADELYREEFDQRARGLPEDLDVLLTHAPPSHILDSEAEQIHYGTPALGSYISRRNYTPKPLQAHLFGHVHDANGTRKVGNTFFSNAATTTNIFDL